MPIHQIERKFAPGLLAGTDVLIGTGWFSGRGEESGIAPEARKKAEFECSCGHGDHPV